MNAMQPMPRVPARRAQSGAILVIALIFLLVLTLIGVTAMQSTTVQERMAGNFRDYNLAMQAAEAALREAENVIATPGLLPPCDGSAACFQEADADENPEFEAQPLAAWAGYAGPAIGDVSQQPRYIIESLRPQLSGASAADESLVLPCMFRITARGVGANPNTVVTLQTTFASPIPNC
jgi:type IV pilus assembly protein PilX